MQPEQDSAGTESKGLDPPRLGLASLPGRCEANIQGGLCCFLGPKAPSPLGPPPSASVAPGTARWVGGRAGHRASKASFDT